MPRLDCIRCVDHFPYLGRKREKRDGPIPVLLPQFADGPVLGDAPRGHSLTLFGRWQQREKLRRIWRQHGLKPHLARTFKVGNGPEFAEKLEAIIGLYLNPPEHAIVLYGNEKSQIQALQRTQPGLPLKKGRCRTMTHDYKHETATLFRR